MSIGENPTPKKCIDSYRPLNFCLTEKIHLSKPDKIQQKPFFEVLEKRVSERNFNKLTIEQLSDLLWYSAKTRQTKIANNGQILSHRPSPSAGGIHPIEIFISLPEQIHKRGLYLYNSIDHSLNLINLDNAMKNAFLENLNACLDMTNATIIWFAELPERSSAKYENYESLVSRDCGALLMVIQLVCTALEIRSCPIGTLGEPFFTQLFSLDIRIHNGGGIYVG